MGQPGGGISLGAHDVIRDFWSSGCCCFFILHNDRHYSEISGHDASYKMYGNYKLIH